MAKIFNYFNSIKSRLPKPKEKQDRIFGYEKYLATKAVPRRALVSYLAPPIIDELSGISTQLFSNNGAGRTIPKVLNQLGYSVDIINWDDTDPIESVYDLVIFHGGKNFDSIARLKTDANQLVYYSTGSYWQYHNNQEQQRLKYFEQRHGRSYKLDREITDSEEAANAEADAIIALGNEDTANTYSKFSHVYSLEAASMPIKSPRTIFKPNGDELGFLFMAGPGNLHKGLDIILDAWQKLPENYHLHIVTYLDDEFATYYKDVLYGTPNIHTHGYVLQRSNEFYEIINNCQYSILLSCSEGSPGSVIESMHQGLIPIISKESHVDLCGHGYVLSHNTVECLIEQLTKLKTEKSDLLKQQEAISEWAEKRFTVSRYEKDLASIISEITK